MKILLLSALSLLAAAGKLSCNKGNGAATACYKGRLEIKGMCMNYTIKVVEGAIDKSLVSPQWQDENTGKTYTDVFGLGSKCNFPANLEEGQEFYFTIAEPANEDCAVCMAYYPTPEKKLSIKVLPGPCK